MITSRQKTKAEPCLSTFDKISSKAQDFLRIRLMSSMVVTLGTVWVLISWLVYRAEQSNPQGNIKTFSDGLWWGVVTFLTVGYGDLYPVTLEGRMLAGLLMLAGVVTVGIVTAKTSSYFMEQALREGRGIVDSNRLKNHFIVCGWKDGMHEILGHILDFNPGLTADQLVMIANVSQETVDTIREQPGLEKIHVIRADYFQEVNLKRAAPERARKILILADRTPNLNGQFPSVVEIDARTVMTAMTLASIARGTLVTAEILDAKMDTYLKLAQVSEIIYSREYSRLLLGNASGGTGVTNIIFDLLDPKTPTVITTHPIHEASLNQKYPEFKLVYENLHHGSTVVGILENTGNTHTIKEQALRQAQKTPDVKRLVENLRLVREIRCNNPIFNPASDYLIPEGAMAIVIENRGIKNA